MIPQTGWLVLKLSFLNSAEPTLWLNPYEINFDQAYFSSRWLQSI